jgi:hypothetical protein
MPTNHTFHLIRHFQSSFKLRHYPFGSVLDREAVRVQRARRVH